MSEDFVLDENKKEPLLVQYAKDRIENKNKHFVLVLLGSTGSGKSYAMLRLAELIDKTFTIDRVCFKAKEFMQTINDLVARNEKGEVIKSKVVCWDELGVSHNSKEFMSISNRVLNYFFQTCRHLNLVIIMSVPVLNFVDASTRKLIHSIGEMQSINRKEKTSSVKIKMIQTNVVSGKVYVKYLRYRRNNRTYKMSRMKFKLPSKQLLEAYEKKKTQFTTALNLEIMGKLLKQEAKENKPFIVPSSVKKGLGLTPLQEKVLNCLRKGITKQREIGNLLNKPQPNIAEIIQSLRKKGYPIGRYGNITENTPYGSENPQSQHKLVAGLVDNDKKEEESK